MKNITDEILHFSFFLNSSWSSVLFYINDSDADLLNWLQANWELLVESKICSNGEFIDIYGDGADLENEFSRVTFPSLNSTHKIIVKMKNSECYDFFSKTYFTKLNDYSFNEFISITDGISDKKPPFDYVEIINENSEIMWVSKKEIEYFMVPHR